MTCLRSRNFGSCIPFVDKNICHPNQFGNQVISLHNTRQMFSIAFIVCSAHFPWIVGQIENNVCTRVTNFLSAHERVIFGDYLPSCEATRQIYTKITLHWVQKQFVMRAHTLYYFLHNKTKPQMTIKTTIFKHRPRVSLTRFSFCWCYNRLLMTSQWPDNYGAITWIVISNWLDFDFIHGDVHGRSRNNLSGSRR